MLHSMLEGKARFAYYHFSRGTDGVRVVPLADQKSTMLIACDASLKR